PVSFTKRKSPISDRSKLPRTGQIFDVRRVRFPMLQRGNWRLRTQVIAPRGGVVAIQKTSSPPRTITSAKFAVPKGVPTTEAEAVQSALTEYVPFGLLIWRTGLPCLTSVS